MTRTRQSESARISERNALLQSCSLVSAGNNRKRGKVSEEEAALIRRWRAEGMEVFDIAIELRRSYWSTKNIIAKRGL